MKKAVLTLFAMLFIMNLTADDEEMCACYVDRDGDGYGTEEKTLNCYCGTDAPLGYSFKKGDCKDLNRYINPGVKEICNGHDDNCDGLTDPENSGECNNYYKDKDGDGYGIDESRCLCVSEGEFAALERGDCDDNNRKVTPVAKEICNGVDDNCNSEIDEGENTEGCRPFYYDADGDGYGIENNSKCLCKADGLYRGEMSGDCNDNNPSIYPGAHEYFDRLDNNCNGLIDENPGMPALHRKKHRHHKKNKESKGD